MPSYKSMLKSCAICSSSQCSARTKPSYSSYGLFQQQFCMHLLVLFQESLEAFKLQ